MAIKPATQASVSRHLHADEKLKIAFEAQTRPQSVQGAAAVVGMLLTFATRSLGSLVIWLMLILAIWVAVGVVLFLLMEYRIVAVTDQRVVVLSADFLRPSVAHDVIGELSPGTVLKPGHSNGALVLSGPLLPHQKLYFRPGRQSYVVTEHAARAEQPQVSR